MNRADTHLSTEALAAYVDGELAPGPRARAAEHIASCFECGFAVGIQAQTKESLSHSTGTFSVPSALLAKLGQIPFDAALPPGTQSASGLSMTGGGVCEFSVASRPPAAAARSNVVARPKKSRLAEMRRSRHFNRGAALIAVGVGLSLSPTLLGGHAEFVPNGDDVPMPNSVFGVVQPVDNNDRPGSVEIFRMDGNR